MGRRRRTAGARAGVADKPGRSRGGARRLATCSRSWRSPQIINPAGRSHEQSDPRLTAPVPAHAALLCGLTSPLFADTFCETTAPRSPWSAPHPGPTRCRRAILDPVAWCRPCATAASSTPPPESDTDLKGRQGGADDVRHRISLRRRDRLRHPVRTRRDRRCRRRARVGQRRSRVRACRRRRRTPRLPGRPARPGLGIAGPRRLPRRGAAHGARRRRSGRRRSRPGHRHRHRLHRLHDAADHRGRDAALRAGRVRRSAARVRETLASSRRPAAGGPDQRARSGTATRSGFPGTAG